MKKMCNFPGFSRFSRHPFQILGYSWFSRFIGNPAQSLGKIFFEHWSFDLYSQYFSLIYAKNRWLYKHHCFVPNFKMLCFGDLSIVKTLFNVWNIVKNNFSIFTLLGFWYLHWNEILMPIANTVISQWELYFFTLPGIKEIPLHCKVDKSNILFSLFSAYTTKCLLSS